MSPILKAIKEALQETNTIIRSQNRHKSLWLQTKQHALDIYLVPTQHIEVTTYNYHDHRLRHYQIPLSDPELLNKIVEICTQSS